MGNKSLVLVVPLLLIIAVAVVMFAGTEPDTPFAQTTAMDIVPWAILSIVLSFVLGFMAKIGSDWCLIGGFFAVAPFFNALIGGGSVGALALKLGAGPVVAAIIAIVGIIVLFVVSAFIIDS